MKTLILMMLISTTFGLLSNCAKSSKADTIEANKTAEFVEPTNTPQIVEDSDGKVVPADLSKVLTVTYCDLIKNAAAYDKKIVRVRAIYFTGFEKTYLYDEHYEMSQTPSAPKEVPAETWAEWDKTFDTKSDSEETKLNRQIEGFGRKDVTVIGRFYSTNEKGDKNAPNLFGHLNSCRFMFRIMRVEKVVVTEGNIAKLPNEYGAKVKFAPHQKVEFADFTLEFYEDLNLLVAVPQPGQKLPKYVFRAARGNETVMIYGNSEPNDGTPLTFEFGAKKNISCNRVLPIKAEISLKMN